MIIQVVDTSAGIKHRINFFTPIGESGGVQDHIWEDLFKKYKILKSTSPKYISGFFSEFSYSIEKYNIESTLPLYFL